MQRQKYSGAMVQRQRGRGAVVQEQRGSGAMVQEQRGAVVHEQRGAVAEATEPPEAAHSSLLGLGSPLRGSPFGGSPLGGCPERSTSAEACEACIFAHMDYLSTVSGGTYIGSCLATLLEGQAHNDWPLQQRVPEDCAVRHLRMNSRPHSVPRILFAWFCGQLMIVLTVSRPV